MFMVAINLALNTLHASLLLPPMPPPPFPEQFLHYVWQFQRFDAEGLTTTGGAAVQVVKPGHYNRHAGPDFTQARLLMDSVQWAGNIEIHTLASHWQQHNHTTDPAYNPVVLHVVWQADAPARRADGTVLPVIELRGRIAPALLHHYERLLHHRDGTPACLPLITAEMSLVIAHTQQRALLTRLELASKRVQQIRDLANGDWEETAFRMLARALGQPLNADAFEAVASSISLKTLRRHADRPGAIEAVLLGQAGFLAGEVEDGLKELQTHYRYLRHKLQLEVVPVQWKLGRIRPQAAPAPRLLRLAAIVAGTDSLFSIFCLPVVADVVRYLHRAAATPLPGAPLASPLGKQGAEGLVINAVVPLLVTLGDVRNQSYWNRQAHLFLELLPFENNQVTRRFTSPEFAKANAFDSQALTGLYKNSCRHQQCLDCPLGGKILGGRLDGRE